MNGIKGKSVTTMNVAYINKGSEYNLTKLIEEHFQKCTPFDSEKTFLSQNSNFAAIVFQGPSQEEYFDFLKTIRKTEKYYITPVFFGENTAEIALADGNISNWNTVKEKAEQIHLAIRDLKETNTTDWKNKLLFYLYSRKDAVLKPISDWQKPIYFYYPLIETFYEGEETYFYWLDSLIEQNIITRNKLVDQLFCCPYCFSAHLKFTDHCPSCNSINIKQTEFLHCFSCGFIAPQEEFIKNDRLQCSRCNAKLKLVGEDYDRPLESGICLDCKNFHVESKIKVTCVSCNKTFNVDDLNKRAIYELILSDFGRNQIRFNSVDIVPFFIDKIKYVSLEYFYNILNWLIGIQIRYKEEMFSLLGLKLQFSSADINYEIVIGLAKHLRTILRATDFCTKSKDGIFWFIFPKTDVKGVEIIKSRIAEFLNKFQQTDVKALSINFKAFTSSQETVREESSKLLIAKLTSEL